MTPAIIPREHVAQQFAVTTRFLLRIEGRGLVRAVRVGEEEGYEPSEVRRLWSVLSLHRELGINLAGIEAIFQLQRHYRRLQGQMDRLLAQLEDAVEGEPGPPSDA
jgi:MerR family transcriptional regulator/heat shock protein HspR